MHEYVTRFIEKDPVGFTLTPKPFNILSLTKYGFLSGLRLLMVLFEILLADISTLKNRCIVEDW